MTTDHESMAIEILKGEMAAAYALADSIREAQEGGYVYVQPLQRIVAEHSGVRAVAYMDAVPMGGAIDPVVVRVAMEEWLREGGVLMIRFCRRLDVYRNQQNTLGII